MKTLHVISKILIATILFFSGMMIGILGIEFFLMDNSNEWSVLIKEMPDSNKIIVAIMMLICALTTILSIFMVIRHIRTFFN